MVIKADMFDGIIPAINNTALAPLFQRLSLQLVHNIRPHRVLGPLDYIIPRMVQPLMLKYQNTTSLRVNIELALLIPRQKRCRAAN